MSNMDERERDYVSYSIVNGDEKGQLEEDVIEQAPSIGKRHGQVLLYFIILFVAYGFRVNLSVAIVAMTDPKMSSNPDIPTYPEWTQKGAILSAFFWGYIWPQALAGYCANRFGAKWFLVGMVGTQSVAGFCTPLVAAYFGEIGVMTLRMFQGLCQGFLFPSVTHLLSSWAPVEERARLANLSFSSVNSGTVVGMLLTGIISSSKYGWPMVFYGYGLAGAAAVLVFAIWGYNSPAVHPSISKAEKYYIEKSLGHIDEKPSHKVPWKAIATSKPVWALLLTQCGYVFGFWILLTQIPTYMSAVMNFDIKSNSMLSALPYIVSFIISMPLSVVSDCIINKGLVSQTNSRKIFNSAGVILPSAALICMGFVKSDEPMKAEIFLVVAVSFGSCSAYGWGLNHMDLTPNHAGTLMGLCNGISSILAILAPLTVQALVKNPIDPADWKIIFFLAAGIQIVSGMIFNLFATAEIQPWNYDDNFKEQKEGIAKT